LKEGAALGEHTAPGPLAIQVLRGQVQITAANRTVSLAVGQLVVRSCWRNRSYPVGEVSGGWMVSRRGTQFVGGRS